jgi:ABC-type antimicrobial peptide transport system permease subunit
MFSSFQQAIRGLTSNITRTALTTLGIVIGIATVIVVLSAGAGFNSFINAQLQSLGTNSITVETRVPPTTKALSSGGGGGDAGNLATPITTMKNQDVTDIKRLPNVVDAYGAVIGQKVTAYKNVSKNAMIFGADASRFDIDQSVVAQGRPYTEQENAAAAQVAVLGSTIATDLFGDEDPIGKTLRIGTYNFTVIGVYEKKALSLDSSAEQVFVPLQTAQKKLLGIDYLFYILAQARDNSQSEATAEDIRGILRENHNIPNPDKDDFAVNTQAGNLSTFNTILTGITFLLIAVAAISLLVGGVGIMNIMYVVVTERISEIGLKKSLGAKYSDILSEFLIEAILLTAAGGILGIALGAGVSYLISLVANGLGFEWEFSVPLYGIILGVGVSSAIGLVFGVFPARRAAKMDPMEALRHE